MIRLARQWLARRRLAQLRKANIARVQSGPPRHHNGQFARKERKIA